MAGQTTNRAIPSRALLGTPLKRFHREFRRHNPLGHDLVVVLQSVEYPANVGSAFRIADAVKVTELVLTGLTPTPPQTTVVKVARNKHRVVPWRYEQDVAVALGELRELGYRIFALEIAEESKPYYEIDWPKQTCVVIGHEDHGITRATLAMCDQAVFVPMWGKGLSLNAHVALAVVLYHIRYLGIEHAP
jgi:23S rRNA (guanosine2251-2'-O)-methyltransferase